ncbi:MAG: hypothetical protein ACRD0B_03870 [Acidimicrobiales bacterium]
MTRHIRHTRILSGAAVVVALGLGASACSSAPTAQSQVRSNKNAARHQAHEAAQQPEILAADQSSNGYSVQVARVHLPEGSVGTTKPGAGGYVAVSSDVASKPGTILGYTKVGEGISTSVPVRISSRLRTGTYDLLLFTGDQPPTSPNGIVAETHVHVVVR